MAGDCFSYLPPTKSIKRIEKLKRKRCSVGVLGDFGNKPKYQQTKLKCLSYCSRAKDKSVSTGGVNPPPSELSSGCSLLVPQSC